MIDVKEFTRIKKNVETAKSEKARAEGSYDQLTANLKEDFECDGLEEAESHIGELQEEKEELEGKYSKIMQEFQEKWPNLSE